MTAWRRYDDIARQVGGRRVPGLFGNQGFFGGFDVVYNCVGGGPALTDAAKFTRARGTLVVLDTGCIAVVDTTPLWFSELNVLGCNGWQIEDFDGRRPHTYRVLFELIEKGGLDSAAFPTRIYPFTEDRSALHDLIHPSAPFSSRPCCVRVRRPAGAVGRLARGRCGAKLKLKRRRHTASPIRFRRPLGASKGPPGGRAWWSIAFNYLLAPRNGETQLATETAALVALAIGKPERFALVVGAGGHHVGPPVSGGPNRLDSGPVFPLQAPGGP